MFDLADIWAARTGHKVRLVSANDHIHSRGSAHYEGLALDFQSSNDGGLSGFFREAGYHVLWRVPGHYGHVHVEHADSSGPSPVALNARHAPRQGSTRRRAGARVGG
jgi:hypothetical protein